MARNHHFHFKQFSVHQQHCAMKVSTDACLFGALVKVENSQRILDIGTGTGLLALMAAQRSSAKIDAIELDSDAAAQAQENFASSPWHQQLAVHCISIQEYAEEKHAPYDHIICNPPFFTQHMASADSSRHQARHNDSLSFATLCRIASQLLTTTGKFEVLLPASEHNRFLTGAQNAGLYLNQATRIKPTTKKPVNRHILTLSPNPSVENNAHITIHGTEGYTPGFVELLQPYYLAL